MSLLSPLHLGISPLFDQLTANQLDAIRPLLQERFYPKGAALLTMGQRYGEVYLVMEGSVRVLIHRPSTLR